MSNNDEGLNLTEIMRDAEKRFILPAFEIHGGSEGLYDFG